MSKCAECGANNFHTSFCGVPYRDEERGRLQAEILMLKRKLDKAMDYINDLADNGFEKARVVKKEIEGMK